MAEDRAYFEQAGIWDTAPEPYQIQVRADILSMLPPGVESVLDAGCGNGFITNALPNGLRVVGLDISQEALRYVEREKKLGSITDLPFADKSFDLIMTNDVIEHLDEQDLQKALNELRRVARKYILITVPLNEQLESNQARCADCGCVYHVNHHLRSFSERTVEELIRGKFQAVETRLSGAFSNKPFDPTVPLRHELGVFRTWQGGICPKCNSHAQIQADGDSLSVRALNAMRIRSWARRLAERGPWNNRSEAITLFSASPKTYRAALTSETTTPGNPLRVDFSNPAQQAQPDFTPGMVQPMFLPMGSYEVASEGLRATCDGKNVPSLRVLVCFPFEPKEHDQIALQCAGAGGVTVRSLDAMLGKGRELISENYARGKTHHAKTGVPLDWWPGRTGWALEIEMHGSLTLCSLELVRPAGGQKSGWELMALEAGHTVCSRGIGGVVRSWGCLSDGPGKYPLPQMERLFSGETQGEPAAVSWREFSAVLDRANSHIRREAAELAMNLEATESARAKAEEGYAELNRQYRMLQSEKERVEGALEAKEAERARAEEGYAELGRQYRVLQSEKERVEGALEAKEAERVKAEAAYWDALASANAVESARAKAEEGYAELGRQYQILQSEKERVEGALEAKEAERAKAEAAYWDVLANANAVESARAKAEEGYAELGRQYRILQSEKERVERALEAKEAERAKAEAAYWDALANANAVESARAKAEEGYAELGRQYRILRSEKEQVERTLETKEAERAKAEAAYAELCGQHGALQRESASLKESLAKVTKERDAAENGYVELNRRYSEATDRAERLAAECQAMRGIWGGTREVLYAVKKGLLRVLSRVVERTRSVRRFLLGYYPGPAHEEYPPEYIQLDHAPPLQEGLLRVLLLSHMFPHPQQPTLGPFVLEQAKALRKYAGVDARVVVGRPFWFSGVRHPLTFLRLRRRFWDFHGQSVWREIDGVPVLFVPFRTFARQWMQAWFYREAVMALVGKIHQDFPFELVHAHTSYLDGTAGAAVSRKFGVPLIITEHTSPFSYLTRHPVVRWWTRRALNRADRVVSVSRNQKDDVTPWMRPDRQSRSIIIHNGVDTDLFHPPAEWKPDPRNPRLLFIGGFEPRKNVPLLLSAIATLQEQFPGIHLNIIGAGQRPEDSDQLRNAISSLGLEGRATILGTRTRREVAAILRDETDVLVLPSKAETFGCVLVEALACGKPVVATRCGGPEDIIADDFVGLLCDNDDVRDLSRALAEMIGNLSRFNPERIRAHAVEHFGFEPIARHIAGLYREVIGRTS